MSDSALMVAGVTSTLTRSPCGPGCLTDDQCASVNGVVGVQTGMQAVSDLGCEQVCRESLVLPRLIEPQDGTAIDLDGLDVAADQNPDLSRLVHRHRPKGGHLIAWFDH